MAATPTEKISVANDKPMSARERSTIEFPYSDLDDAIEVARAIYNNAGSGCTLDQLSAYLRQPISSGSFRVRVSNARIFGLTENERGEVRLTDLGRTIADPSQESTARVQAFLRVPLYRAIFDKFKGFSLPPASGLEREMGQLGVSSKQTDRARQAFMRSANQAGFFAHGQDRLVIPANTAPAPARAMELPESEGLKAPPLGHGDGNDGSGTYHPFIQGLLKTLPEPHTSWKLAERAKWLQTASSIFGLIYTDDAPGGIISIAVQGHADKP